MDNMDRSIKSMLSIKSMPSKIPVAVIGANGYTGVELFRILACHPGVHIEAVTSRQFEGIAFSEIFPAFARYKKLKFSPLAVPAISRRIKTVFLCLPHHEAMGIAAQFRARGVRVIDLSADFRLRNPSTYEKWYGPHSQKKLLQEAVYGLPELYRAEIRKARLIASPGCYPTSVILGLAPLVKNRMIHLQDIICDSKSGVSGAGRTLKMDNLFTEVNESFKAYSTARHRHTPEIEQELSRLSQEEVKVLFSPHLIPIDRGILSTLYVRPLRRWSTKKLVLFYKKFYKKEPFVTVLPEGQTPATKNVRGTNQCQIGVLFDERTDRIVVISAIDNLTKGASGQAVQSFNLMQNWPETMGLEKLGWVP